MIKGGKTLVEVVQKFVKIDKCNKTWWKMVKKVKVSKSSIKVSKKW